MPDAMKPWLRIDYDMTRHRKMARLPSDSARWGWMAVLGEAKVSDTPGGFEDDRHFAERVGRFARYLPDYLAAGLLERRDDGLRVHDWREYQPPGDPASPGASRTREYRARLREREKAARDAAGDTSPPASPMASPNRHSRAVSSPSPSRDVDAGGVDGGTRMPSRVLTDPERRFPPDLTPAEPQPDLDAMPTSDYLGVALEVERLTQQPYAIGDPDSRMGLRVRRMLEDHGQAAVINAFRDISARLGKRPTTRQLVFAADDLLNPVPTLPRSERDCETCLNTGVTAKGARCPDCHRGRTDR